MICRDVKTKEPVATLRYNQSEDKYEFEILEKGHKRCIDVRRKNSPTYPGLVLSGEYSYGRKIIIYLNESLVSEAAKKRGWRFFGNWYINGIISDKYVFQSNFGILFQ